MKYQKHIYSIVICLIFCIVGFSEIAWSDGHIQIKEKEKQIVLKGHISKALGEYDSHLKGAVEFLMCGPAGKEYESILVVDATAKEVHEAMTKLDVKPGNPVDLDIDTDELIPADGPTVIISVEWDEDEKTKKVRAEDLLHNVKTNKPMKHVAWIYTGSRMMLDLEIEDEDVYIPHAFNTNDIVSLSVSDPSTLFVNPLFESSDENLYKKNDKLLPELGTPVRITIEVNQKMQLYVLISGKVQGVGFRHFTRVNATKLGIKGYAKNLTNGKVEVVAEGKKEQLYALVRQLRIGPTPSKVDNVKIEERDFTGQFDSFGIRF